jgi:hypothetical protein
MTLGNEYACATDVELFVVFLYYTGSASSKSKSKSPYCPSYIAKGLTVKRTLSLNGLPQSMHCCTVSSRYLETFFAASKHNYDVHITTDILVKE